MTIQLTELTNVGPERDRNEDATYVSTDHTSPILAVADGMGGHNAGDVASRTALDEFVIELESTDKSNYETALTAAVREANDALLRSISENPEYEGMGTTLVGAIVEEATAVLVNVGDSRAYHVTDEEITQVTEDQSLVQQLVNQGTISEDEAADHAYSNVVSQSLGTEDSIDPDIYEITLQGTLLLCSDGLSDVVPNRTIYDMVRNAESLDQAAAGLIDKAIENGTTDNVSVALARID